MRIKPVRAGWQDVVLVRPKCSLKLDGGFGSKGKRSLAETLRRTLPGKLGKRTRCLDLCPRNAVVVLRAAIPDRWVVVPRGMAADQVMAELGLGPRVAATHGGSAPCVSDAYSEAVQSAQGKHARPQDEGTVALVP